MTELSFAKAFLSTLDNRAIKLQPDHAADLKTLELKGAVCLPHTLLPYPVLFSPDPPPITQSFEIQRHQNYTNIDIKKQTVHPPPLRLLPNHATPLIRIPATTTLSQQGKHNIHHPPLAEKAASESNASVAGAGDQHL